MKKEQYPLAFYGRRMGRPLRVQRTRLMAELLPSLSFKEVTSFDFSQETWLEIGFGAGLHLATMAARFPTVRFIGCEVFTNGVASLLQQIEASNLTNIHIFPADIHSLIPSFPSNSLGKIFILFPDPWPKIKHRKRRLVNEAFMNHISRLLTSTGEFLFATDYQDYSENVLRLIQQSNLFSSWNVTSQRPEEWPLTHYNQKAIQSDRTCWYIQALKH